MDRKVFLCIPIMAISFQIVGYTTNAWAIKENGKNGIYKHGLWSTSVCTCNWSCCKQMTHKELHESWLAEGVKDTEIMYAVQVYTAVEATLGLAFGLTSVCLSVAAVLKTQYERRIRLGIIFFSALSGCILLSVVGEILASTIGILKADIGNIYFPWSLLFSGFGGVVIFTNGALLLLVECLQGTRVNRYLPLRPWYTGDSDRCSDDHMKAELIEVKDAYTNYFF